MQQMVETIHQEQRFEIRLNRPDKRNAINMQMYDQFEAAIAQAEKTPGLRAVIICGAGKVFSTGIDVSSFLQLPQEYGADHWLRRMRTITDRFQSVLTRLERLELPTIAVLHGYCLGLALEMALACDIRLAAEGTRLGLPETRLGMIPDVGGTTRLTRLVGPGRAKEIIFTGSHYEAEQFASWGILNDVVPHAELDARVDSLVAGILQAAPLAVGMAKRVIDGLSDIDRGLMLEGWAQSQLFSSEDLQEGIQAFMTKQQPHFQGK